MSIFKNPRAVEYTKLGQYDPNNPCNNTSYYVGQIGDDCNRFRESQVQLRQMQDMPQSSKYRPVRVPPFMNGQGTVETYVNSRNPNYLAHLGKYQVDNPCNLNSYYGQQIGNDCDLFVKNNLAGRDLNGNPVAPAYPFMNCDGGHCAGNNPVPSQKKTGFGMGIF